MSDKDTVRLTPEGDLPETPAAPAGMQTPSDDDKLFAALSYASQIIVPILVPVVLLIAESSKQRQFQKYHAIHSLTLLAITVLYEIVAVLAYTLLGAITGGCVLCFLWPILLVPVVVFVYYAYEAYQGTYFEVPYLTKFLREQNWL